MNVCMHAHTYVSVFSRISSNERTIQLSRHTFLIGGIWLSCFTSLIFIVLFSAGWQGVKFKLEQVAQKERKKACPCQHLKVALLKSLILECRTVCPVDVWPHNMAQN